jgi:hypothetical protein
MTRLFNLKTTLATLGFVVAFIPLPPFFSCIEIQRFFVFFAAVFMLPVFGVMRTKYISIRYLRYILDQHFFPFRELMEHSFNIPESDDKQSLFRSYLLLIICYLYSLYLLTLSFDLTNERGLNNPLPLIGVLLLWLTFAFTASMPLDRQNNYDKEPKGAGFCPFILFFIGLYVLSFFEVLLNLPILRFIKTSLSACPNFNYILPDHQSLVLQLGLFLILYIASLIIYNKNEPFNDLLYHWLNRNTTTTNLSVMLARQAVNTPVNPSGTITPENHSGSRPNKKY